MIAKQQVESLLSKFPENCSLEDSQYHLYVLDKVRLGLDDAKTQGTLSQDDVENRLSEWLTEVVWSPRAECKSLHDHFVVLSFPAILQRPIESEYYLAAAGERCCG